MEKTITTVTAKSCKNIECSNKYNNKPKKTHIRHNDAMNKPTTTHNTAIQ